MTTPITTPADPFDDPAESGFFGGDARKRLNGSLLAFEVHKYIDDLPNANSKPGIPSPAVKATIHVLDGQYKGEVFENSPVYGAGMLSALETRVGGTVLARLGQGPAKPGKSAPWILIKATPEDKVVGVAWHKARQEAAAQDPFAA